MISPFNYIPGSRTFVLTVYVPVLVIAVGLLNANGSIVDTRVYLPGSLC